MERAERLVRTAGGAAATDGVDGAAGTDEMGGAAGTDGAGGAAWSSGLTRMPRAVASCVPAATSKPASVLGAETGFWMGITAY